MTQMYNISSYDPGAYLTNLKNEALQRYNQQMGASGAGADISLPTASQATNIARGLQRNLTSSSPLFKVDFGMEYPLRPEAANKAKDLYATALSKYNASPTAQRLIDTGKIGQAIQPSSGGLSDLQVMYHGTSPESASQIKAGEFKGGKVPTWAGTGKVFVTPNIDVASRYPTTGPGDIVETVVPKSSTRLPGGGISIGDLSPLQKLGKVLPVAGNVISAVDAYQRAKEGDYAGAALSGLGALPVVGIPATLAQYATDALGLTGQKREEGLASLPEAQPIQANTNINPLDYDNLFDFYGDYLRPYIAEEQPGYRTFIGDVSPGYIGPEGEGYNPILYEQYLADRARGKEIFNTRFD